MSTSDLDGCSCGNKIIITCDMFPFVLIHYNNVENQLIQDKQCRQQNALLREETKMSTNLP